MVLTGSSAPAQLPGMTLGPRSSVLSDRALEALSSGPLDSASVLERVCAMTAVAAALADHLATALFAADERFARDASGRWTLASTPHAPPPTPGPRRARRQIRRAGTAGFDAGDDDALANTPFAVIDTETTGTSAYGGDRITELAIVRVLGGDVEVILDTLVNPERPIPAWVTRVTSITTAMVRRAPRFGDVAEQVAGALEGHVFVAHNAGFDWRFLRMEMTRATGRPLAGTRLCTVALARALVPSLRRRSLDHLAHHYGVAIQRRHRAGGDARATAHILVRLLADARRLGCEDAGDLMSLAKRPGGSRRRRRRVARPHSAADAGEAA